MKVLACLVPMVLVAGAVCVGVMLPTVVADSRDLLGVRQTVQAGVCCFGDTDCKCRDNVDQILCATLGGVWGPWNTCDQGGVCLNGSIGGSCCLPDGQTCVDVRCRLSCTDLHPAAVFRWLQMCAAVVCEVLDFGACCFDGGACEQTFGADCAGTWAGAGVPCGNICAPNGGLCVYPDPVFGGCLVESECTQRTDWSCCLLGGEWSTDIFCGVCVADVDGDGVVAVPDLLVLLAWWNGDPGGPPDLNGDGIVNVPDLLILLGNWGTCP